MPKPKLVICAESKKSSLLTPYLKAIIDDYFDIEFYNAQTSYERSNTIFVMSWYHNHDMKKYMDRGYAFFVDALWEARPFERGTLCLRGYENVYSGVGSKGLTPTLGHTIEVPNFFWYNESMMYHAMGYQNYVPDRKNTKLFLMPMGKVKPHRDAIYNKLQPYLDNAIYSYAHRDVYLPNSEYKDHHGTDVARQFDPAWYDETYFSIAVETVTEPAGFDVFLTEKTFKVIAHRHPFMIWGTPGSVAHLRQQGFESFDHVFDEYYDECRSDKIRLINIAKNVKNFDVSKYQDPVTEEKIEHNFQLFFNQDLVKKKFTEDVIHPLLGILK